MKNIFLLSLVGLFLISCSGDSKNSMTVNGSIKGLKKGTLYLQQLQDTVLVNLDSLEIKGNGDFSFESPIENPDIYYLYLVKNDHNDINDRITFFGEPGIITVDTAWDTFDTSAKITGSKTNEKLEEYKKGMSRYNAKNLEILQMRFDPKVNKDSLALDSLIKLSDKNIYRSYAYALNFALNNKDSYIAPYIAINEVADANMKYLDSIHKMLTPEVAASKYGKQLKKYLEDKKKEK
ncbi:MULTISPECIES: DUF4369 domain-containing protein [Cellulophaga]|jgi:hypothetical protein|uniref:DUF4369 domain-containing protein n=1 Tax=Cellulophaga TaxID=104264 RepID=UPI000497E164|nr:MULTISPECIES: DUF4369 domain-containing protein [Cellulophaga]KGK31056.1 hypothetical protein EL45_07425 [Cellulophaga sp. E6(2014)]MCR1026127.1 DUF4369 domain-containing protein [Cellulophaga baltica]WFO17828.1 DUF4369 domain-containing protein [Cellulophaga baltica 4]